QRRAAVAGERQGEIALWGAGVSLLALIAAISAVVFARNAATATAEQAAAAVKGNELARIAYETEHLPWVAIGNLRVTKLLISPSPVGIPGQSALWIDGVYDLTNSGSTPALAVSTWHLPSVGQRMAPGVREFDDWLESLRRNTATGGARVIAPN